MQLFYHVSCEFPFYFKSYTAVDMLDLHEIKTN